MDHVCTRVYTQPVESIGIRELRKDLSLRVRQAAAGKSIVVTVDGNPKARLVPAADPAGSGSRGLDDLITAGRVIPARRRGDQPPDPPPMFDAERPSIEVLDEIRRERLE
jgi:prevent-host-death family protein